MLFRKLALPNAAALLSRLLIWMLRFRTLLVLLSSSERSVSSISAYTQPCSTVLCASVWTTHVLLSVMMMHQLSNRELRAIVDCFSVVWIIPLRMAVRLFGTYDYGVQDRGFPVFVCQSDVVVLFVLCLICGSVIIVQHYSTESHYLCYVISAVRAPSLTQLWNPFPHTKSAPSYAGLHVVRLHASTVDVILHSSPENNDWLRVSLFAFVLCFIVHDDFLAHFDIIDESIIIDWMVCVCVMHLSV